MIQKNNIKLLENSFLKDLKLKNKIIMPPMDTYSAVDGYANDFHVVHYGSRVSTGLIIQEATSVREDGRISDKDLGIWDDKFIPGLKKIVTTVHNLGGLIGIQLGDAGRKSSLKGKKLIAPSDVRFSEYYEDVVKMSKKDIKEVINLFKNAAIRAKECGYDLIEIHGAHGYLVSQFISSFSNKRNDEYGGSLENRFRFLKEILFEIREVYNGILGVRISADEWVDGGMKPLDIVKGLEIVKEYIDFVDVSTGGTVNDGTLPFYPGYQLEHAKIIKENIKLPVIAVGLIDNFDLAEYAIRNFNIDFIAVGRAILRNPNWIYEQCYANNIEIESNIVTKRSFVNDRFVDKNLKR